MPNRTEARIFPAEDRAPESAAPVLVEHRSASARPTKESGEKSSNRKEESDSPFEVSVTDVYEGPLDLLLVLIR